MLKVTTASLKQGLKELAKFKAKESFINLYTEDAVAYLTKTYINEPYGTSIAKVITYKLDAEVEDEANYLVTEQAVKAIAKISENYININKIESNTIQLTTTKRTLDFKIEEDRKFNSILLIFGADATLTMSADEMKVLLQVTDYAASDDTRPILKGVCFKHNKAAALDGYRLCIREFSAGYLDDEYIVHSEVLRTVGSLLKQNLKTSIEFSRGTCKITVDNLTVYSDLLEGQYVKYESLIPQECTSTAIFDKAELKEEIDFILSLKTGNSSLTKFSMTDKTIALKSSDEAASSTIKLEKAFSTGDIEIAFNTEYIASMLKHFNDKVTCEFTRNMSPMVCRSEEIKGLDMILPIRVFK